MNSILKKRTITSAFLLLLVFLIYNSIYITVLSLLILGVLSTLEFLNLSKIIFKNKIFFMISNLIFIIFISIFTVSFFILFNFQQSKFLTLVLLLGCVASDLGGYIIGKSLKGPKLTKISPNKTVSGAFGSFIFSCAAIISLIYYKTGVFNFSIFLIGFFTSLFCQLGDLFFSFLKRKAKLKDTGNFLPGHGGVLDRLDGIFFGLTFGFITIITLFE